MMKAKKNFLLVMIMNLTILGLYAQTDSVGVEETRLISTAINLYAQARENKDTALLRKVLTARVDQLVSTGEWRMGINAAIEGMMKSSSATPGTRTLHINKLRKLTATCALVDCKYEIKNENGTRRTMWSSFIIIKDQDEWKISAIRNMLPASN